MKKIIFFSRCELVHLYGRLTPLLLSEFQIKHLAYSNVEKEILEKRYGIKEVACLKDEIPAFFHDKEMDYNKIHQIDQLIIAESQGAFCLNSAIQSDRTFAFLEYNQILRLCQAYFDFWEDFLNKEKPFYLIHEPVALFMTQIAAYIINKTGGFFLTTIQGIGPNKYNWIFVKAISGELFSSNVEIAEPHFEQAAKIFFLKFDSSTTKILFPQYINKRINHKSRFIGLIKFWLSIVKLILTTILRGRPKLSNHPLLHIEEFLLKNKLKFVDQFRMRWDRYFYLKFDNFDDELNFFYYPIHMEPEATVLYWGEGIYKNQVKLIENIAAQLPPNIFLIVKDHPHGIGDRNFLDYKRIKSIPNVKLIDPMIPGREVIKKSLGVITINGTGGFEGFLMRKKVVVFGKSFYTNFPGVYYVKHIKDLKSVLYTIHFDSISDSIFFSTLSFYLNLCNVGFTDYFSNFVKKTGIDETENDKLVAQGFVKQLK